MRGRAGCAAVARRGSERARRMVAATTYRLRGSNSYFIARIKFIASGLSRAHFVLCGLYIRIRNRCRGLFRNRIRIRDQDICTDSNVMYASVGVQFSCVDTIIHTRICGQRQTHIRVCQTTTHVCTQLRSHMHIRPSPLPFDPSRRPTLALQLSISTLHLHPLHPLHTSGRAMAITFTTHMFGDEPVNHAHGCAIVAHVADVPGPLIPGRLGHVFVYPVRPIDHTLPVHTEIEMEGMFAIAWLSHCRLDDRQGLPP